mgnify:CR=1 FL=1
MENKKIIQMFIYNTKCNHGRFATQDVDVTNRTFDVDYTNAKHDFSCCGYYLGHTYQRKM